MIIKATNRTTNVRHDIIGVHPDGTLTDEELLNMSVNERASYTDSHPDEAWRVAKIEASLAARFLKKWFEQR